MTTDDPVRRHPLAPHEPAPGVLRLARPDDVPALLELERRADERFRDVDMCGLCAMPERAPASLADAIRRDEAAVVPGTSGTTNPAEPSGEPDLIASVQWHGMPDSVHVDQLCVDPIATGNRWGAALLDAVSFVAGSRGLRTLTLTTFRDVPWNAPYYPRLGWRPIDDDARPAWLVDLMAHEHDAGLGAWPRVAMQRHVEVPTLVTERLRLRPWRFDDAPLVQRVADDPLIPLITTVPASSDPDDARAFVERQQARLGEGVGYSFALALEASDVAVGQVGVWTPDVEKGRVSLGYWIEPAWRRQGLLTEALARATAWALAQPGVERAEVFVEPWNEGSWRSRRSVRLRA